MTWRRRVVFGLVALCAACAGNALPDKNTPPTPPSDRGWTVNDIGPIGRGDGPASNCRFPAGQTKGALVRLVLLSPSDRPARPGLLASMEAALRHVQQWFASHSPQGTTFTIHEPPVENANTTHPAGWYASHDAGGDAKGWFWQNVTADGFALTSARYDDPSNRWIFYADADADCGQQNNGVLKGVALVSGDDLRGLMNEPRLPPCPGQTVGREQQRCRWVGGMAWMIGAATGLKRPASCATTACPAEDLMSAGLYKYPETAIGGENGALINDSPFFSQQQVGDCPIDCAVVP